MAVHAQCLHHCECLTFTMFQRCTRDPPTPPTSKKQLQYERPSPGRREGSQRAIAAAVSAYQGAHQNDDTHLIPAWPQVRELLNEKTEGCHKTIQLFTSSVPWCVHQSSTRDKYGNWQCTHRSRINCTHYRDNSWRMKSKRLHIRQCKNRL